MSKALVHSVAAMRSNFIGMVKIEQALANRFPYYQTRKGIAGNSRLTAP